MNNKHTNVLYINYCLAMGGIETMIVGFTKSLDSSVFKSSVAVFEGGGCLEEPLRRNGISVFNLEKKAGFDFGLIFRLRSLVKTHDIKVVHTNNFATWLYAALACIFLSGVRTVHTEHSTVRGHKKRRYLAEKFLVALTDGVVTVSQKVKDNMVELCKVNPDKVKVITNGIDIERFKPDAGERAKIRIALGLSEQHLIYGTVGRVVPVKDHVTLVKSFALVFKQNPMARLIIVGSGECMAQVETEVNNLDMKEGILLVGERHDIPALLTSLDIYVVSSLSEGMSISVLEAMSASLPIVATNVGGNPEIVTQGVNGLLVPSRDVNALSGAMLEIADDDLRASMAKASRERVIKDFSNKVMMEGYCSLYIESKTA